MLRSNEVKTLTAYSGRKTRTNPANLVLVLGRDGSRSASLTLASILSRQGRGGLTLADSELVEAVVVDAEVVGNLVDDGQPDLLDDLVLLGAHGLYRLLE